MNFNPVIYQIQKYFMYGWHDTEKIIKQILRPSYFFSVNSSRRGKPPPFLQDFPFPARFIILLFSLHSYRERLKLVLSPLCHLLSCPAQTTPQKSVSELNPPGIYTPEKIPLNAVERKPVPTGVLNLNASEASYKPKHRSSRKNEAKKNCIFFSGGF